MFKWWLNPKNSFSIVRIPIAIILVVLFLLSLRGSFVSLINCLQIIINTGSIIKIILFVFSLPFTIEVFFFWTILYGILFYFPYFVSIKSIRTDKNWKILLMYLGISIGFLIVFASIGLLLLKFLFGFSFNIDWW